MKYFVILSLMAFCAYQLISIQAAPNAQLWAAADKCPENTTTEQECIDYVYREGKGCSKITVKGKCYSVVGCSLLECEVDGKLIKADLSKPYPDFCLKC